MAEKNFHVIKIARNVQYGQKTNQTWKKRISKKIYDLVANNLAFLSFHSIFSPRIDIWAS